MKKTLLLSAVAFMSLISLNAQKTWNISSSPFTATTYSATTAVDGLTIMATSAATVTVDANNKVNGSLSFTQRLKLGGSGSPAVTAPYLPTTRALVFNVSGPGTIQVCALSSSSSASRSLIITNGTDSLGTFTAPGSYTDATGDNIELQTYNYTGNAATIYIYSPSSGVNIYYLNASTYVATSVRQVLANKGITFDGAEINNSKSLPIEVYNVLGKRVVSANTTISTKNFQRGIYIVRVAGTNDALKIII